MKSCWILFIVSLPGRKGSERMRLWRSIKATGAALLRDGVYLLPQQDTLNEVLDRCSQEILALKGQTHKFIIQLSSAQLREFKPLFDRRADYHALHNTTQTFLRALPNLTEGRARLQLAQLQRDGDNLIAIDFFSHHSLQQKLQNELASCKKNFARRFNQNEPTAQAGIIRKYRPEKYQHRRWATRHGLWIDRIASAWLIRRFIDKRATFIWLADPEQCDADTIGFDFDGALFSHVGDKVTFEVLVESFNLQDDQGLKQLAAMVHYLDVGGIAVPEGDGFSAILAGAKFRCTNDDMLLNSISVVLDDLYHSFVNPEQTTRQQ